jgi:hydroxymethylcytosylglucuronate/cytosylglucuronate synthase
MVSLGGLVSPLLQDPSHYLKLVVPAALNALGQWGARQVILCGNVSGQLLAELRHHWPDDMEVRCGPLGHQDFLDMSSQVDVLLASPGLTTLLEASMRGTPVVCLPPQNISQIFNASFYGQATEAPVCGWPDQVVDKREVLDARLASGEDHDGSGSPGEDAALEKIYKGISTAADAPEEVWSQLTGRISACLVGVEAQEANWTALAKLIGTDGARQVSDTVFSVARAAAPSPGRAE